MKDELKEELIKLKVPSKYKPGEEAEITRYVIEPNQQPTGIVFGKFFPFTGPNGHGRLTKFAETKFGPKNYIIASPKRNGVDPKIDIFTKEQREQLNKKANPGIKFMEVDSSVPIRMFRELVESGIKRPVFVVGNDRIDEFKKFFIEYNRNNKAVTNPEDKSFGKGEYVFDPDRGTSGTKVRGYLLNNDKDSFLKDTKYPEAMWNFMRGMLKKNGHIKEASTSFVGHYLTEGGYVSVMGIPAQKIQVAKMDEKQFEDFKDVIHETLKTLNEKYHQENKDYIWDKFDQIFESGKMFSGSSVHMFTKPYEEFVKYKKVVGDVDLQIPKEKVDEVLEFLKDNEGKKFGEMRYIGNGGNSKIQINVIFETPKRFHEFSKYIQVDFEPTDYENHEPTAFAGFGHHSSWEDIKQNVKGAIRRYLFGALLGRVRMGDIAVLTDKGHVSNSKNYINPTKVGFSVDRGIRMKFVPVLDKNGKILLTDGKPTYKETPKEETSYEKNLSKVFALAFGKANPTPEELDKMHSFFGCIELMKKYLNKEEMKKTFDNFINYIWGEDRGEQVEKDNKADLDVKMAAYDKLVVALPFLKLPEKELHHIVQTYYAKHGGM